MSWREWRNGIVTTYRVGADKTVETIGAAPLSEKEWEKYLGAKYGLRCYGGIARV